MPLFFSQSPNIPAVICQLLWIEDTSKWLYWRLSFKREKNDNLLVTVSLCGFLENMCDTTVAYTDSLCPVTSQFSAVIVKQNRSAASSGATQRIISMKLVWSGKVHYHSSDHWWTQAHYFMQWSFSAPQTGHTLYVHLLDLFARPYSIQHHSWSSPFCMQLWLMGVYTSAENQIFALCSSRINLACL